MTKKKSRCVMHRLSLFQTTLVSLLRFDQAHLGGRTASVSQHLVVVTVTVGRVAASHAAVVAEERYARVGGAVDGGLENLHTVADVDLHVEQVLRAATPLAAVERHHLHQTARANRAAGARVEGRIFSAEDTDQQ